MLDTVRTRISRLRGSWRVHRVIGWAVVALGVTILVWQVRSMVRKDTVLPNIRHPVYLHERLYEQALSNADPAIATGIAPFYLIERKLKGTDLIVGRALARWRWFLESVCRTRVKVAKIADIPVGAWDDLTLQASHETTLGNRKLYLLAGDPTVKTYVFVQTTGETGPLFIVPETVYRARVADNSGANLSAP
jgi:hypothetical protein